MKLFDNHLKAILKERGSHDQNEWAAAEVLELVPNLMQ
jgi:hypothetical protein